jgi:C_GCAxxG_C_C family probable redox protein
MNRIDSAASYHDRGYGCAQSVLASYADDFGLSEEHALKLATGFGSGMGRMCHICGALTGGFMVIGLKYGKYTTDGTKYGNETETTYQLVRKLADQFQARNGSILCRELIGYDLNDPAQRAEVVKLGLFKSSCGKYIQDSVEFLEEILEYEMENKGN